MRHLEGYQKLMVDLIATAFAFLFIFSTIFTYPFYIMLPLYICINFVLIFFLFPATAKSPKNRFTISDILLSALVIIFTVFFISQYTFYVDNAGIFRPEDIFFATMLLF